MVKHLLFVLKANNRYADTGFNGES